MEEYLADELTRLGISDADTFAGYVNGMLDGNDPVASPAEARESLTEAIEYINTLCGEASVAIDVDELTERMWQRWVSAIETVVSDDVPKAPERPPLLCDQPPQAPVPPASPTRPLPPPRPAGGETQADAASETMKRATLARVESMSIGDERGIVQIDNRAGERNKVRAEVRAHYAQRRAELEARQHASAKREEEQEKKKNHRLNRSKAALRSEAVRQEEGRGKVLAQKDAARRRRQL